MQRGRIGLTMRLDDEAPPMRNERNANATPEQRNERRNERNSARPQGGQRGGQAPAPLNTAFAQAFAKLKK